MSSKVYVGNLPYSATEDGLRTLFGEYGDLNDPDAVKIITDRETGRSKGFGFLSFGSQAEAEAAISALNEKDYEGRPLRVNIARDPKTGGGGGGGRGRAIGGGGGRRF